jgi:hypothetical protein
MLVHRLCAKIALVGAQSSTITILIGYLLLRSQWVIVPGLMSVAILMMVRCRHCDASFREERIYKHMRLLKFYDTRIIDSCPVCGHPMLGEHNGQDM